MYTLTKAGMIKASSGPNLALDLVRAQNLRKTDTTASDIKVTPRATKLATVHAILLLRSSFEMRKGTDNDWQMSEGAMFVGVSLTFSPHKKAGVSRRGVGYLHDIVCCVTNIQYVASQGCGTPIRCTSWFCPMYTSPAVFCNDHIEPCSHGGWADHPPVCCLRCHLNLQTSYGEPRFRSMICSRDAKCVMRRV